MVKHALRQRGKGKAGRGGAVIEVGENPGVEYRAKILWETRGIVFKKRKETCHAAQGNRVRGFPTQRGTGNGGMEPHQNFKRKLRKGSGISHRQSMVRKPWGTSIESREGNFFNARVGHQNHFQSSDIRILEKIGGGFCREIMKVIYLPSQQLFREKRSSGGHKKHLG